MEVHPLAALAVAGIPAWLSALVVLRRARAEKSKIDVETEVDAARELRDARREARELEERAEAVRRDREAIEGRCQRCESEVARLTRLLQSAMVGAKLDTPNPDILALFDQASDLWALTSPTDRGSFIWVSAGWADLGIELRHMLGSAWRDLVTPETRKATDAAESSALSGALVRFGNCFRCPDGRIARLEWWSTSYDGGSALCFARVAELISAPPATSGP